MVMPARLLPSGALALVPVLPDLFHLEVDCVLSADSGVVLLCLVLSFLPLAVLGELGISVGSSMNFGSLMGTLLLDEHWTHKSDTAHSSFCKLPPCVHSCYSTRILLEGCSAGTVV